MAKIIVQKIKEEGKTNKGTAFWMCLGTIDGELDEFKVWDEPQLNVEFEAEVKDNGKYGKAVSSGRGGNGRDGGRRYERDPEVGNQIMRQNALDRATQVALKLADLTFETSKAKAYNTDEDKDKAMLAASNKLQPANIIRIADFLFRYNAGQITTAATTSAPASSAAPNTTQVPITEEAVKQTFPESLDQKDDPSPAKGQDVNPNEIPL